MVPHQSHAGVCKGSTMTAISFCYGQMVQRLDRCQWFSYQTRVRSHPAGDRGNHLQWCLVSRRGVLNGFARPPNDEIEPRLIAQGDHRPFTIDGALPFPPKPHKTKKWSTVCVVYLVRHVFVNYIRKLICASKVVEPKCDRCYLTWVVLFCFVFLSLNADD